MIHTQARCKTPRVGRRNYTLWLFTYLIFCENLQCQGKGYPDKHDLILVFEMLQLSAGFKGKARSTAFSCESRESRTAKPLPVPKMFSLSWQHGQMPAGLEYCLFPCLMKGPHLWWSGVCEVCVRCPAKEKSLSQSLAARSAEPHTFCGLMHVRRLLFFRPTVC